MVLGHLFYFAPLWGYQSHTCHAHTLRFETISKNILLTNHVYDVSLQLYVKAIICLYTYIHTYYIIYLSMYVHAIVAIACHVFASDAPNHFYRISRSSCKANQRCRATLRIWDRAFTWQLPFKCLTGWSSCCYLCGVSEHEIGSRIEAAKRGVWKNLIQARHTRVVKGVHSGFGLQTVGSSLKPRYPKHMVSRSTFVKM